MLAKPCGFKILNVGGWMIGIAVCPECRKLRSSLDKLQTSDLSTIHADSGTGKPANLWGHNER